MTPVTHHIDNSYATGSFRSARWYIILTALLIMLFVLDLTLGSVRISIDEVIKTLFGTENFQEPFHKIIWLIRFPKAIAAVLAGSALAVGGLLMQTMFRNPLAGPSVLGITSGASLGVAAVMLPAGGYSGIYMIHQLGIGQSWLIVIASTAGAAMVMFLILGISLRIRDNVALLIIGIMIGNLTISAVSIWQYFSNPEQIQDYLMWTFGSLGGVTNTQLIIFSSTVMFGTLLAYIVSKPLNVLLLGENYARSIGIRTGMVRLLIIASASILAGTTTGFTGPIAFVGIAVPHITRNLLNQSDHRILIPATMLAGAALMLICDIIAQVPGSQITLPINAITALIGSPVVIWIILKRRTIHSGF